MPVHSLPQATAICERNRRGWVQTSGLSIRREQSASFVAVRQGAPGLTLFGANPLEVWAIERFGAWWPLAKLAPMALVAVVMMRWPPRYIVPGVALMAAVVASNAVQGNNSVLARLILFSLAVSCACWAAYRAGDYQGRLEERVRAL